MDYPLADRWRRPLILLPGEAKPTPFTRCTTVAKTLDGTEALSEWKARKVAEGCCLRDDLRAQFAATLPSAPENKALQNKLIESLLDAAKGPEGANMGDALHSMTARVDTDPKFRPLPNYEKHITLYKECLERHGIETVPEYVERTVVLPDIKVAGSFDRLVRSRKQRNALWVLDLKTGRDMSYSWPSISIQLSIYARAKWLYDWDKQACSDMPDVDQHRGLVLWLPYGQDKAELHVVDLDAGWEAAQMALAVRAWRTRKNLAREAWVS